MQRNDITGQQFNKLTAIRYFGSDKFGKAQWLFQCECGNEIVASASHVVSGHTQSCGCYQQQRASEAKRTHGHTVGRKATREYETWQDLIKRCTNKNHRSWDSYGGRGITVCDRWLESFENFLEDTGEHPGEGYSIDRIDVNGNYEPGNVRWATTAEQARNRRDNRMIEYQGRTQCLTDWAEELGMTTVTLWARLYDYEWSVERAFTEPVRPRGW